MKTKQIKIILFFLTKCFFFFIIQGRSFDSGVTFRVWAPNAGGASVVPYTSNGRWNEQSMTKEANGTFYVNVGNAQPGDSYYFQFTSTPSGTIKRIDPRAQAIQNATGNFQYSVVHDPNFTWDTPQLTFDVNKGKQLIFFFSI